MESSFATLNGLRAVVTGASSGIGRAVAVELARGGADVVLHCRAARRAAEETAELIRQQGRETAILTADFAEAASYLPFIEAAWNCFGRVDVWVNNAGIDLLTGEAARWPVSRKLERLFEVDIRSTFELSREAGRRMRAGEGGVILNIGWDQAQSGMEGDSGELFAAAKGAVMSFSRSLALSLAPQVRVNCIAPGWIRTAWGESAGENWQQRVLRETPLRRWGTPDDIARLARFLASAEADFITGQVINVNGGAVR